MVKSTECYTPYSFYIAELGNCIANVYKDDNNVYISIVGAAKEYKIEELPYFNRAGSWYMMSKIHAHFCSKVDKETCDE